MSKLNKEAVKTKAVDYLEPADIARCQADKPTGYTFMTLGGQPGTMVQCTKKPVVIITEKNPGKDGLQGEMSLCADCLDVFNKQPGTPSVFVSVIRNKGPING